jgi:hypothetical protein
MDLDTLSEEAISERLCVGEQVNLLPFLGSPESDDVIDLTTRRWR